MISHFTSKKRVPVRISHLADQKIILKSLQNIVSFVSIFLQAISNEMLGRVSHKDFLWEIDLFIDDAREIVRVANFKGDGPIYQFVSQNSNVPDVNFAVIVLAFCYLRRIVEWLPTLGVSHKGRMDSPSKITNFDCILHDKDVLRLDIAVNGIILVHVSHCHTNFLDIFYHIFFLKGSFVHSFVKILPRACLKEQVDEFRISSKAIEVDDMRVIKITLDDGFSDELFEALLIQLALLYDRETVNSMCDNILHQMNLTITAFIQKFQHLKYFFLLLIRRVLNYLVLLRLRNDLGGDF